jgi:hypothetical protein
VGWGVYIYNPCKRERSCHHPAASTLVDALVSRRWWRRGRRRGLLQCGRRASHSSYGFFNTAAMQLTGCSKAERVSVGL